jgi:hypothetical protein
MFAAKLAAVSSVVGCLCICVCRADAQIVFDNGTPSKSGGFISDASAGVRFADDFVLAGPATLGAIRFWGFYPPTDTPSATDDFTVVFYGNSGGLPNGANVLATNVVGSPSRIDTGDDTDGGGLDIYVYDATFTSLALGPGQYWVSVYNNTPADVDDNWAWARHSFPGNDARSLDQGATWIHEFSDSELAFQLIVPEPPAATLVLVAIAMVAAMWLARRGLAPQHATVGRDSCAA